MIITRVLHAGYVFEHENTKIIFDPIFENPFSRNCYAFPEVEFDTDQIKKQRFDAVFISHHHDDHCSLTSLDLIDRKTPIYVYCPQEEIRDLIRELEFTNVNALEVDQAVTIDGFTVTPRLALDPDVDSIFHIKAGNTNVLNVVDAWIDPSALNILKRSAPWDVVLWPFQTMREIEVLSPKFAQPAEPTIPEEWIEQLKELNPKIIVPSSCQFRHEAWSWLNQSMFPVSYARFTREINEALPDSKVVRLDPGESLGGQTLSWAKRRDEQLVDYTYDANVVAPPTSEIARQFPALSTDDTRVVHDYCRSLMERHTQARWRLTVWDHEGAPTVFQSAKSGPVEWTTDVPVSRLHGALTQGESLTSMYVRINDGIEDGANLDPMEDPLVRALFDDVFGAYQRAQLRRLL